MYFVVLATDKPGRLALRSEIRPKHREYLRSPNQRVEVIHAGPTLSPETGEMNGTLLLVSADRIEDVHDFVVGDPYLSVDLFESIVVRPWLWSYGNQEDET